MNFKHSARFTLLIALFFILIICPPCISDQSPKNVILFIGDGMGLAAITAGRITGPGRNGSLAMDTMPVVGLVKTHTVSELVTDSAAAGTAMATGVKTKNGVVSLDINGKKLRTLLEVAEEIGKSTGLVTSDNITSATPAAFVAHVKDRDMQDEVAVQLLESGVDVAMGSGRNKFSASGRNDGRNLILDAKNKGYAVISSAKELSECKSNKILGLFGDPGVEPGLTAMTEKAISALSRNNKGFFLMVESAWPDKGGHNNDKDIVTRGVLELDKALRYALKFANANKDTLVIVTADHETGGLSIGNSGSGNDFSASWTGKGHTGSMVVLYAFGPGANKFAGTLDNTDIPRIISKFWGKTLN